MKDYYELRFIDTASIDSSTFSLFEDSENRITLFDYLKKQDKILLLGNPGIGKSTELKVVFDKLWDCLDDTQEVPLFINIKNFRRTSSIEDLLVDTNWQDFPAVILIIDGLDEIADIQDFVSELELFIDKFIFFKIKYILSCRTNIYEKYLINISGFESVYLKNLSDEQIKSIFKNKYDLDISYTEIYRLESILQTPFNIDLFANYYIENESFPESIEESWELFIGNEIEKAKEKIIKRFRISKPQILNTLKKVAVTNELMQQNAISEEHLFELLDDHEIEVFQELPFIEKLSSLDHYIFRHKNFQEYFAAKYISSLPIEEIIDFIKAKDLNKIKPSLFNTTTFLLNIIDGEKYNDLKEWLFNNDIEVLFFADDNRLTSSFKNEIFEKYYTVYCIEKTFWLANNNKISIDTLAKFANFDLLISEINNKDRLERVRLSALDTLSYKILTDAQKIIIKNVFKKLLDSEESFFQSNVLRAIKTMRLHKEDIDYWNDVLKIVENIHDRDVSHQIISILNSLSGSERDSTILLKVIKNHSSDLRDNVLRGTENIVGNIILETEDKNLFLELFKLLFNDLDSLHISNIYALDFNSELIKKAKYFSSDSDFITALLDFAFIDDSRIMGHELLNTVLSEIGLSKANILYVLTNEDLKYNSLYSLSRFFTYESVDEIAEKYKNGELKFSSQKDVTSVRNWMSHNDLHLALHWEKKFIEIGFEFPELLYSEEDRKKKKEDYESFRLYNLKLLFSKEDIVSEVENFFSSHNISILLQSDSQKMFWKWYEDTGYHGLQYVIHVVIERAFRYEKELTPFKIQPLLDNSFFYLLVIKSMLSHNSLTGYNLENTDQELIQDLATNLAKKIDFNNVIKFNSDDLDRFVTTENYEYIKILLHFDMQLNITQSKEFYLNALEYGNITNDYDQEDSNFIDYVKKRIEDDATLNKKVIFNINNQKLIFPSHKDHIIYAINNNLTECFDKIGEDIISTKFFFNQPKILENYLEKLEDPLTYLKSWCTDITSYHCWTAVELIKNNYRDDNLIVGIARNYLDLDDTNFAYKAVNILFYLNEDDALYHYNKILDKIILAENADSTGFIPKDIVKYNVLGELDLYDDLFYKVFNEKSEVSSFYLHQSKEFMRSLTAILSQTDEGHYSLKKILEEIRVSINEKSNNIFHINNLIEISDSSYLSFKSQKESFNEVVKIIK